MTPLIAARYWPSSVGSLTAQYRSHIAEPLYVASVCAWAAGAAIASAVNIAAAVNSRLHLYAMPSPHTHSLAPSTNGELTWPRGSPQREPEGSAAGRAPRHSPR